ncbi:hypothetical protein N0V82_002392 [Gnomoniopsis sp. IMI 355080]|nr:hypothetical protein N0V82_002392 [Gnomoniopsis sp. IMI 355080]
MDILIDALQASRPWLLGATLVLGILYFLYLRALPKPLPGIPYNKHAKKRLLGDLPEMGKFHDDTRLFWAWFTAEIDKHKSPIMQVFMTPFGGRPHVVVADLDEAHDILVHRHKEFDRADFFQETMGGLTPEGHILFKSDAKFRYHRKVIGDLMSPGFLHNVAAPSLHTNLSKIVDLWNEKARLAQGRPFEAIDDIYYTALDAVTSFTFSSRFSHNATSTRIAYYASLERLESISSEPNQPAVFPKSPITDIFVEALRDLGVVYEEVLASVSPRLRWWFMMRRRAVKEAVANKDAVFRKEIDEGILRLKKGNGKKDYTDESLIISALDHMLMKEAALSEKEGRQPDFHRRLMYDELLTFISAGHDTSSTTVTWGVKRLADNRSIQDKLRRQLRTALDLAPGEAPSHEQILNTQMPYLDAVVEEMLRCAQPVPGLVRQATVDTQILGCHIPKGTQVFMLANGPGMFSPSLPVKDELRTPECLEAKGRIGKWAEDGRMDQFVPERWLVPAVAGNGAGMFEGMSFNQAAGPMMAFSLGPRGCFGRRLAYVSLKLLVTLIVWNFELLPCPEELSSYKAHDNLTNRPDFCYVRLKKVV